MKTAGFCLLTTDAIIVTHNPIHALQYEIKVSSLFVGVFLCRLNRLSHKFEVSSFRNTISYQLVWFDRTKTVKTIDLCQWMSLFVLHKSKPKYHSQSIYVNVNRIAKCATLIRTYMATLRNYRIYTHHFALSVRRFYIDFNQWV